MRIDWWTLGLQTINVLVLIWLLRRFLFQPVKAMIEARRTAALRVLDEAEGARAKARDDLAGLEARRREFQAEGATILAAAHAAAAKERQAMLDQAREEAARLRAEARATLEREGDARRRALEAQAGELAVTMARRLLDLLPPAPVTAALLDGLAEDIGRLPEEARRTLAAAGPVTVTTAVPLPAEAQAAWQARVAGLLGAGIALEFRYDPSLIAGAELRGPHMLLRRHWRADLERLAQSLPPTTQACDVHQLA